MCRSSGPDELLRGDSSREVCSGQASPLPEPSAPPTTRSPAHTGTAVSPSRARLDWIPGSSAVWTAVGPDNQAGYPVKPVRYGHTGRGSPPLARAEIQTKPNHPHLCLAVFVAAARCFVFFPLLLCSWLLAWRSPAVLAVPFPPPPPDLLFVLLVSRCSAVRVLPLLLCFLPCRWLPHCGCFPPPS